MQPNVSAIDGINDYKNIYFMRGPVWVDKIKKRMSSAKKAIIVGDGYIDIEAAEAFTKAGIDPKIIDVNNRILNTCLDEEFTNILEENSKYQGLEFIRNENVWAISGDNKGNVTKIITNQNI